MIGLENSHRFFNQSGAKLNLNAVCTLSFSRSFGSSSALLWFLIDPSIYSSLFRLLTTITLFVVLGHLWKSAWNMMEILFKTKIVRTEFSIWYLQPRIRKGYRDNSVPVSVSSIFISNFCFTPENMPNFKLKYWKREENGKKSEIKEKTKACKERTVVKLMLRAFS